MAKKHKQRDQWLLLWSKLGFMPEAKWRERLVNELAAKDLSWRKVSLDAGLSAGYLAGVISGGKEPTLDRLQAVCDAAGLSLLHVLTGLPADRDTERILRSLGRMSKARREAILAFLADDLPEG